MRRAGWIAATVAAVLAAAALGSVPLFALGLGLLLSFGSAAAVTRLAARRVRVVRTLDRHEALEGSPVTLRLAVSGVDALPVHLEAQDAAGTWRALDGPHAELALRIDRPGGHVLEPTLVRVCDHLSLFARPVRAGRPEALLVLPEPAAATATGRRRGHDPVGDPEPDGLRPYVPGTPMTRIHWASVARGGELQERAFATTRDRLPLVVVDTAGAAGDGAVAWAARTAAGHVLALAHAGGCRVLLPGDRAPTLVPDVAAWPAVHRRLAALEPGTACPVPLGEDGALRIAAAAAPTDALRAPRPLPAGVVPLAAWTAG